MTAPAQASGNAQAPSKARKILKRTLMGGTLASVLALLLWWTSRSDDGRPIFYAAAVILIAAVFEVAAMGTLALRALRLPLLLAAVFVLALSWCAVEAREVGRNYVDPFPGLLFTDPREKLYTPYYLLHASFAVSIAVATYSFTTWKLVVRRPALLQVMRVACWIGLGALLMYVVNDPWDVEARTQPVWALLLLLAWFAGLGVCLETNGQERLVIVSGLALWLVPPLPALWAHWAQWGIGGLVCLLVLSKIGDTAGYYVGSAIGRTHPFPRISPGKTTAGVVASLVAGMAAAGVLHAVGVLPAGKLGLVGALGVGATTNIAAQAGDLLESWVKRRVGVKDSSTVFGPSGGVLDQIDSLLVSVPIAALTWPLWLASA